MASVGEALAGASSQVGRTDAVALATFALGVTRAWLVAHDRDPIAPAAAERLEALVGQRAAGTPVAYLTGAREFYGRAFQVSAAVLIPRPETERLVEAALERLPEDGHLLDLGTGSGALAVTLACERPRLRVTATDLSREAIGIAEANARAHGARVNFREGHWYEPLGDERFDMIVSNPPYVAAGDPHLLQGDLRFEPALALSDGSLDGLASLRHIVEGARAHLRAGGWLLVEHGHDQAAACASLLERAGLGERLALPDLAGIARVAGGRLAKAG